MVNKQQGYDPTPDPKTGRPPLIEREENEDLEVDEGTATAHGDHGNPENQDNTGAERKVVKLDREFDDAGDDDEADPAAIDEEMRNQDS